MPKQWSSYFYGGRNYICVKFCILYNASNPMFGLQFTAESFWLKV